MEITMKKWVFTASATAILVAIDQVTKALAVANLKGNSFIPLLGDVFVLEYVENTGAAFGIFKDKKWLFIISTILVVSLVLFVISKIPYRGKFRPLFYIFTGLMAGALGNMIDRVRLGYVVDFLYFKLINFPVFNLADCYIVISVLTGVALLLFYYKESELTHFVHLLAGREKPEEESEN